MLLFMHLVNVNYDVPEELGTLKIPVRRISGPYPMDLAGKLKPLLNRHDTIKSLPNAMATAEAPVERKGLLMLPFMYLVNVHYDVPGELGTLKVLVQFLAEPLEKINRASVN